MPVAALGDSPHLLSILVTTLKARRTSLLHIQKVRHRDIKQLSQSHIDTRCICTCVCLSSDVFYSKS